MDYKELFDNVMYEKYDTTPLSDDSAFIQGIKESLKGLKRVSIDEEVIDNELKNNYEVIGEAIQTILRKNKIPNAYEKLKKLTRGKKITKEDLHQFINELDISKEDKEILLNLEPKKYIGISNIL